ncbi:MAG TPA: flagellar basal body P-ring formation chaperone FlgA [Halanaerobiales bacterium]|nr:flagellar basal body P-ring formation chaperone FlgA [Halanaerobiales bacterium]
MKNKRSILALTIMLIISITVPLSAFEVIIEKEVRIKEESIKLGKIAEFNEITAAEEKMINEIDLGKAPLPGYKKYINKALVKLMLKKQGFKTDEFRLNFPEQIIVRREAKQIEAEKIKEFLKKKLNSILRDNSDKFTIEVNLRREKITIPKQAYSLEILENRDIEPGQMTIPVAINIAGKEYKRFYIPVNIKVYKEAYVAKKYISQGTKLKRDDFVYKMVEVDSIEDEKFVKKGSNIFTQNIELSYSLKQGDILKKNNYNTPYLINWGDRVQAKIIVGDVELTLMVVARERGKQGQYINVENPKNRYKFQAKVISPQLVELIKD